MAGPTETMLLETLPPPHQPDASTLSLTMEQLEPLRQAILSDFELFCRLTLDPGFWSTTCHRPLVHHLSKKEPRDKLIVMARGHLKTSIASIRYPLWRATRNPSLRCGILSNNEPNAREKVRAIRGIVESNFYRSIFPDCTPDFNARNIRWSDMHASLRRPTDYPEATFEAAGVGTNLTGRHYNLIIEDDTVAPRKDDMTGEEITPTKEDVEKAIGLHKLTIPLLIDFTADQRVYIGTRWAEFDCIDYIMRKELYEQGERYDTLNLPSIDAQGNAIYERFPLSTLEAMRRLLSPWLFSALYLNMPLPAEQMTFNPRWTRYYEQADVPQDGYVFVTVDPADPPTGKSSQCFSVALAAYQSPSQGLFVLEYVRDRVSAADLISRTLDLADSTDALRIRIEVDRYPHLEAGFRAEMSKRGKVYVVEEVKTRGRAKEARIMRLQPLMQQGLIRIRRNMPELEHELYQFPRGATNDLIDALAWQVLEDFRVPDLAAQAVPARKLPSRIVSFDSIMSTMRRHHDWRSLFPAQCPRPRS